MATCKQKGYKVGDQFRVVEDARHIFSKGAIVELARDDGSSLPWFNLISGECVIPEGANTCGRACLRLQDIEPFVAAMPPKEPTPCEEKGYKVGDRFNVIGGTFKSMIIQLAADDGTSAPYFHEVKATPNGIQIMTRRLAIHLQRVRPYTYPIPQAPKIEINIKRPKESRKTRLAREAEEFMRGKVPEIFYSNVAEKLAKELETAAIRADAFQNVKSAPSSYFFSRVTFAMRHRVHAAESSVPRTVRRKIAEYIQEHYAADGGSIKWKAEARTITVKVGGVGMAAMSYADVVQAINAVKQHIKPRESLLQYATEETFGMKPSPHAMGRAFDFKLKTGVVCPPTFNMEQHARMLRAITLSNVSRTPLLDSIFNSKPTQKEEKTMITIKKVTYVNNTDISECSDAYLFGLITDAESAIERLEKIAAKPAKLIADIKQRKADIAELVKLIDGK
ncbi:MAG: hypothetical protein KAV87_41145 [Desulfobacteraceae bacterium]|nr:hypothetical protein [Desulfobacteraceae bacterium]